MDRYTKLIKTRREHLVQIHYQLIEVMHENTLGSYTREHSIESTNDNKVIYFKFKIRYKIHFL